MKIEDPAFNYDKQLVNYSAARKTDPHIAQYINTALGPAKTILNVGAGTGSYEPEDKYIVAVEPSASMRSERIKNGKVPAINAKADSLPFDDNAFDASMGLVTIHHWPEISKGLSEMKRVTKGKVVIMTFDPDALHQFWNAEYFPGLIEIERARYPKIEFIIHCLGGSCQIIKVPIPLHCIDGFQEAYFGRPEAFLNKEVRNSQSAWGFLDSASEDEYVHHLKMDLETGEWDKKFGHYRNEPFFTGALRLVVSEP